MKININSIKYLPDKFAEILELHRANTKTLGFLPEKAFQESTNDNKIILATDTNGNLAGYLLYNINKRGNFLYISHLCVSHDYRNMGVAKSLFKYFISQNSIKYRGVRVTCRVDYEATKVWEKLGFTVVHEKPGRSREGSILYIWWFDFNHADLFSNTIENSKMKIVLDSNIIIDLMDSENERTQNSFALLADWLVEDVEYYITDQLKNDISHSKIKTVRDASKNFISKFKSIKSDHTKFFEILDELKKLYNKPLNNREEADIRHLTRSINSDASYFLTKDEGIIKRSNLIFKKYSLLVLKPEEFIIEFSSILNNIDYQPARLSGTTIQMKTPDIEELRKISNDFFQSTIEKKKEFEKKVQSTLTDRNTRPILIKSKNENIVFYTILESNEILNVKFFRYVNNLKSKTIINQIIHNLIYKAWANNNNIICISEEYIDQDFDRFLSNYSFLKIGKRYFKFIGANLISFQNIMEYLKSKLNNKSLFTAYEKKLAPFLADKKNSYNIEKFLFPLKIIDAGIPCFIIPIKPQWAMNLFSVRISEQDLFGGDEHLLFNKENVYYRTAKSIILENNSRILWYISKGNSKFYSVMNISASSYLSDYEIDKPKHLFKKYNRLGIYKWEDIVTTANGNLNNNIMAFSFDLTENFLNPVSTKYLNEIYSRLMGRNFFYPQSPYKISEEVFFEIYKCGMKVKNNES